MVAGRSGCDRNRLKLLLENRLPEPGQTEVEGHLETCEDCCRRLEELAADARWWEDARRFLRPDPVAVPPDAPPISKGGTAADTPAGESSASEEPALDFLDPSDNPAMLGRLGPYEVVELIGRGGMGVVLKGFDRELNRYVAIKILAPHLATSAAARQRFAREARAAAAVVHEHVVAIHAVAIAGRLPYLVMPFVAGQSLQERLNRSGPLELKETLRIGIQVAEGLAAAHAQGLVHRDVKPANILLENTVKRVKITDFGLARAVDDASLTHSSFVAGTPQYMAPEQARGEAVDHRADLFSLGSVLYAMCTGHSPFRAESTLAVLRRISEDSPRPIRQVNPEIPEWLDGIVERLLEKDPRDRFQSAGELAELLGQHLAHLQQPSAVPMPPRARYRSSSARAARKRLVRRVLLGMLLVSAIGLGAAGGALGLRLALRQPGGAPEAAETGRLGQSEAMPQDHSTGPSPRSSAGQSPPPSFAPETDPLRSEVERIYEQVYSLEERARPSPEPFSDPVGGLLRETQEHVQRLEEEMNTKEP